MISGSLQAALLAGGGTGLGLALIAYGWRPPRPALAEVLDRLNRPPTAGTEPSRRDRVHAVLAAPAARAGLPRARTRADLALLGISPAEHLAEQTALAVVAGAGGPGRARTGPGLGGGPGRRSRVVESGGVPARQG